MCDCTVDCLDSSDEIGCSICTSITEPNMTAIQSDPPDHPKNNNYSAYCLCPPSFIKCSPYACDCIHMANFCDGILQCGDGSDELLCANRIQPYYNPGQSLSVNSTDCPNNSSMCSFNDKLTCFRNDKICIFELDIYMASRLTVLTQIT